MKKFIPFSIAIISVLFFLSMILKNEHHLKNSQSIYVKLKPVDPRSLIQGDYMQLNYELFLTSSILPQENLTPSEQLNNDVIKNKSHLIAFVELDIQNKVIHTYLKQPNGKQHQKLILRNPKNQLFFLYPASQSFLFAEGLAECYSQAKYAELKVDQQGNSILAELKGDRLQKLDCDQKKYWWKN